MIEFDGETELVALVRLKARDLVALAHFHRLLDADEALGLVLLDDASRLQQEHERAGGTIHDRQFGRRQLHDHVVHTQAGQCRHQVLHGLDLGAVAGQPRAQRGLGDQLGIGRNFNYWLQIDATEHDAVIDRCRAQGHIDLVAAMQADAGGADGVLESALLGHGRSLYEQCRQTLNRLSNRGD